ncbi:MAG: SRPBCC family protein [Alphaproteobacteria bacterium]|nr:SRPBCC family protein [Alphaproteobacteria bacterium]
MDEKSSIDLNNNPREIVGTRVIDAPREIVWQAWTDPKHLAQWWGPIGFTTTTSSFDMRPGGVWRFVMHGPDGRDYQNRVTFIDIVKPERIVYRHGGGDDVEPVLFETTVVFEDFGGKTRLVWTGKFPTADQRTAVIKNYGADKGLLQTMARLAEFAETKS